MKAIELNSSNFDQTLADATVPVLVDFHAQWCGPCKMLGPVIDQIAADKDGQAIVAKVDIDEARDIAERFQITSVPSLIVFQSGEPVAATRGVQSKAAIEALIDQASDSLASA
ncbi:MAG: thioredoxin [Verrucomicrobiales bacterium]|nr:thioredoxin [Verrucomicrobiales bacterium]